MAPLTPYLRIASRAILYGGLGLTLLWKPAGIVPKLAGVFVLLLTAFYIAQVIRRMRTERAAAHLNAQNAERAAGAIHASGSG